MTDYLVGDGTTGANDPSFAYKYTNPGSSSGIPEIYVGAEVYVCPSLATALTTHTGGLFNSQDFWDVWDLYGDGGQTYPVTPDIFWNGDNDGPYGAYSSSAPNPQWDTEAWGTIGPVFTSGLHLVQQHLLFSTDTLQYMIDGTLYDLSGLGALPGWMSQADVVTFGAIYGSKTPQCFTNLQSVTVGTTGWGSTDLLTSDFSSGFTGFDGTYQAVSIRSTPQCGPFPPIRTPIMAFDGQRAFQVA